MGRLSGSGDCIGDTIALANGKERKPRRTKKVVPQNPASTSCTSLAAGLISVAVITACIYYLINFIPSDKKVVDTMSWYDWVSTQLFKGSVQDEELSWYKILHSYGIYIESAIHTVLSKYMEEETVFNILQILCHAPVLLTLCIFIWVLFRVVRDVVTTSGHLKNKPKSKQKQTKNKESQLTICSCCSALITFLFGLCVLTVLVCIAIQIWLDTGGIRHSVSTTFQDNVSVATNLLYLFMLSTIACASMVLYCKLVRSTSNCAKKRKSKDSLDVYEENGPKRERHYLRYSLYFISICTAVSIPWEFVRMYQEEMAKKMSVIQAGIPQECFPHELGVWASLKSWLRWQFSWDFSDHCERYHQALLVDPLWEVTPLMVLTSAFTRCVTRPVEIFCHSLGRSLRLIFVNIPVAWQPIVMVILVLLTLTLAIMKCRYKISLPMFVHIEPSRTPRSSRKSNDRTLKSVEYNLDTE